MIKPNKLADSTSENLKATNKNIAYYKKEKPFFVYTNNVVYTAQKIYIYH